MIIGLRVLLFVAAALYFLFSVLRIRKSNVRIMDMVFWILMSALLVIMGIFPEWIMKLSHLIGFESPINFVFLVVIFLLLFKCFSMSIQISTQSEKINSIVEELAIRMKELEERNKQK